MMKDKKMKVHFHYKKICRVIHLCPGLFVNESFRLHFFRHLCPFSLTFSPLQDFPLLVHFFLFGYLPQHSKVKEEEEEQQQKKTVLSLFSFTFTFCLLPFWKMTWSPLLFFTSFLAICSFAFYFVVTLCENHLTEVNETEKVSLFLQI